MRGWEGLPHMVCLPNQQRAALGCQVCLRKAAWPRLLGSKWSKGVYCQMECALAWAVVGIRSLFHGFLGNPGPCRGEIDDGVHLKQVLTHRPGGYCVLVDEHCAEDCLCQRLCLQWLMYSFCRCCWIDHQNITLTLSTGFATSLLHSIKSSNTHENIDI